MKVYCRAIIICGETHSKPSPYPVRNKPRPKPQDKDFITEKEFKV